MSNNAQDNFKKKKKKNDEKKNALFEIWTPVAEYSRKQKFKF